MEPESEDSGYGGVALEGDCAFGKFYVLAATWAGKFVVSGVEAVIDEMFSATIRTASYLVSDMAVAVVGCFYLSTAIRAVVELVPK